MNDTKVIDSVYDKLKSSEPLTPTTIVILATRVIGLVQKEIPGTSKGQYRKEIALRVLSRVIEDSNMQDFEKDEMQGLLYAVISPMIDTLVLVAKKKLELFGDKKVCGCF